MNFILCVFLLFLTSCDQKPQETSYKEVVIEAPLTSVPAVQSMPANQAAGADAHAGLDMSAMSLPPGTDTSANTMFTWTTPDGWKQEPSSGMRLATFHLLSDPKAIDCSIVSLGGMAGGIEANLRRWMGQLSVQATDDELNTLIATASVTKIKTGQEGKVFDFTTIQAKANSTDKSMIVVMVTFDEATLFVKMSGTVDTVAKNKDNFFKLVSSVEFHPPADTSLPASDNTLSAPNAAPSSADPHAGLDMSAIGGLIEAPTTQNILAWQVPTGWAEEAGKHMRMASFHSTSNPNAIDCYIIALAGPAGGLEANLQRWLGQLGLLPSDDNVKQLMTSAQDLKTKDGLGVKVFDFTALQTNGAPGDKTMIAAMIALDNTTVFVKITGSIEAVKLNKDAFLNLISSIIRK